VSELAKRILVAIVAAPLAIVVIYVGGLPLAALLAALSGAGAWEVYRIARAGGLDPLDAAGIPLAALVPIAVHARYLGVLDAWLALAATAFLALLAGSIWARGVGGKPMTAVAVTLFGIVYCGGMLAFGYGLRYHRFAVGAAAGTAVVALPLILTWASDIGAYAFGRMIGGPKLLPAVSPGKTVAGAVGGLVSTVVVCWIFVRWVLHPVAQLALSPAGILGFGASISVAAQVGDLAESLLKREAGVKDSSRIIPGHGGILDRFDSLLFVLPASYLLLGWLLLPAPR
jgi:phosphatidate cytidylyltransferase